MIAINYQDSRPIYEQIAAQYKKLILRGDLLPGEKMPSVRSVAMALAANPNTVQKAFAELERSGFIYPVRGRGNFVAENGALLQKKRQDVLRALTEVLSEADELGLDASLLAREALDLLAGRKDTQI